MVSMRIRPKRKLVEWVEVCMSPDDLDIIGNILLRYKSGFGGFSAEDEDRIIEEFRKKWLDWAEKKED